MTKRGLFIVFEGCDRSGKSTQCKLLSDRLASISRRFPDRTSTIGKLINTYLSTPASDAHVLNDASIHLLFSANRWEARESLLKQLADGQTGRDHVVLNPAVICDRYAYSGVAFSAAKGLDLDWCKAGDVGLPRPDLVLYFDIEPLVAAQRGDYEERYENVEFQIIVRENFLRLVDER
jgi:dTMP kinase